MDFYQLIEYRKSVRAYESEPVGVEQLERILNAGRLAPAGVGQAYRFVVIKDEQRRRKLAEICCNQQFVAQAPVCVAVCALPAEGKVGTIPCTIVDATIAATHIMFAAAEEGLGTCWIGAFEEEPLQKLIGADSDVKIVAVLPIGRPVDDSQKAKRRKSLDQLICEEYLSTE